MKGKELKIATNPVDLKSKIVAYEFEKND